MNVHRWLRTRTSDRRTHHSRPTETLGLDLIDVMLDLDPGMLVWSGRERKGRLLSVQE